MTKILSVCSITLLFIGVYFVLRALPDAQCGFLHYEEVVNENGEIELCATNHAGFLDLSRLKYPVQMELDSIEGAPPGEELEVTLTLETDGGMPIAPHELAITHTEKMHVMLVDPSLEDYHHVHPEAEGFSGQYHFSFTPKRSGSYMVFAEVVPLRSRRQVIATGEIVTQGTPASPAFEMQEISEVDGVRFELSGVPESLSTNRDYRFELDVNDLQGIPVELETIMGAKGHMVAFDAGKRGFAHMHPIDSISGSEGMDELAFLFNVPNPGWYRVFAQVQVDGREVFGRFDLLVE
ncbi:MAG: hypothetical protein ACPGKS_03990 [Coraliomargarita sp.]